MCNCHSYNGDNVDSGKDSEVILYPKKEFGIGKESVCVDYCISKVVQHLWDRMIPTLNSCCGHNENPPSIILESYVTSEDVKKIREIVAEIDDRDFKFLAWKLTEV